MSDQIIQGQPAGSTNEYNVYLALTRLKLDFSYQYPLNGGRSVRGGQVVDFIVWMPPMPLAIYVQGERWHTGRFGLEELLKQADAEKAGFEVVEIWERECETVDDAIKVLRERIL